MKYYTSALFEKHGIKHLFATRHGGVSTHPDFAGLNVSSSRKNSEGSPDKISNVYENYKIILSHFGISPECAVNATQTHSDIILCPGKEDCGKGVIPERGFLPSCDGIIAGKTSPIKALCVKTADCVPIIFANLFTGDVCAVHAGWRGTVADIAGKAVSTLLEKGGKSSDIIAAIGPCIGRCCYEVSSDVRNAAEEILIKTGENLTDNFFTPVVEKEGKFMADLSALNRELIMRRDVPAGNIDILGLCTCCYTAPDTGIKDFFSHRGSGGHSGTQLTVISSR